MRITSSFFVLLGCLFASTAAAKVIRVTPKNYARKVSKLRAGDLLLMTPGTYTRGIKLKGQHGTARAPIVIQGQGRVVLEGRRGSNTLELSDSSYIVIRGLIFDGKGLPIDAIKAQKNRSRGVHHITIEDCTIRGYGAGQQIVGISTKVPAWNWIIRRNSIIGAGTGMYLGNSNGDSPFIGGLIEYNLIRDPKGYCCQIKRQNPRASVPGMPSGPSTTIIRYNVFIKNGPKGPDGARPNLLVGAFPKTGPGSRDRYQIYGNLFYQNEHESLFQGTGRLSLHDNLFVRASGAAIVIAAHFKRKPEQIRIYHNTIFHTKKGIRISGLAEDAELLVFGNLIVAEKKGGHAGKENLLLTYALADKLFASTVMKPGKLDLQPRSLRGVAVPASRRKQVSQDQDHDRDFLGRKKSTFHHCGAYAKKYRKRNAIELAIPKPRGKR